MSRPKGTTCLLVPLFMMITGGVFYAQGRTAMKGAGPGGQAAVKEAPPLPPPGPVDPGNCGAFGTSYYLQTCSAPGFSSLIEPMFKDRFYPEPAYEKDWQARLRPFIPCIIESLSSKDPCVQVAAVMLLRKSEDSRAVAPLLNLLKSNNGSNGVAAEARQTLAVTFKSTMVVPFVVRALTPPLQTERWIGYDLQAARNGPRDPRLFDVLYRLFQDPHVKEEKGIILTTLVEQRYGPACDERLRKIFADQMRKPGCLYNIDRLALVIASEQTFDDIQTYFFTHCGYPNAYNDGLRRALQQVGGERYTSFLRRYFAFTQDVQQKKWMAEELVGDLSKAYPVTAPEGKDSLDWLVDQSGQMLSYATARTIWPILQQSPDAKADAPANRRAAFYERAAKLFIEDKELSYQIQRRLYEAYGPNGTDEPEKSLEALSAANKAYVALYSRANVGAPWGHEEEALRRDIAVQKMREALKVVDARPSNPSNLVGPWSASLLVPKEAPFDLSAARAVAFLDLLGDSGGLFSIPAKVSLQGQPGGNGAILSMMLQPDSQGLGKMESVKGVRIRILFLPGKSGFYGVVVSEEIRP